MQGTKDDRAQLIVDRHGYVFSNTVYLLVPSSELSHPQRARSDRFVRIKICAKNNPSRPEREADGSRPSRGWIYRRVGVSGCLLLSRAVVQKEWNFIFPPTPSRSLSWYIITLKENFTLNSSDMSQWDEIKSHLRMSQTPFDKAPIGLHFLRSVFSTSARNLGVCIQFNPLNAELNPICHLLALVGAHHILHVSGVRVNTTTCFLSSLVKNSPTTVPCKSAVLVSNGSLWHFISCFR